MDDVGIHPGWVPLQKTDQARSRGRGRADNPPRTQNSLRDRTYPRFKRVVSVHELQDRCGMTLLRIVLVVADCRHHCRQLTTRRGLAPHTSLSIPTRLLAVPGSPKILHTGTCVVALR